MTRLTDDQADGFRSVRKRLNATLTMLDDLSSLTVGMCGHGVPAVDPECPVCKVWFPLHDALELVNQASCSLDDALTRS